MREGDVEAVRRLYYVAMTRASEHLVIGYVRANDRDIIHQTMGGEVVGTNGASRFLFEAGLVCPPKEEVQRAPAALPVQSPAEPVSAQAVPPVAMAPITLSPAPVASPVAKLPAAPKVGVIVQPVKPLPELSKPTKHATPKRATKPWELRQIERNKLARVLVCWERKDFDFAVKESWNVIELVLRRVVQLPADDRDDRAARLIDLAHSRAHIDTAWFDRLHKWRKLRNKVEHDNLQLVGHHLDEAWSLVTLTPDFLAYLAQRVAPKQADLVASDDHLFRMTKLVDIIAGGLPHPLTGKPLKALRFDPEREALEMIPLQFLMVLKDVRFFIPEQYRWDRAPILGRFAVNLLGGMPHAVRPSSQHGSAMAFRHDEDRIYTYLERLLKQEAGDVAPHAFLHRALEDAGIVKNGNYPAGLKLNPKSLNGVT